MPVQKLSCNAAGLVPPKRTVPLTVTVTVTLTLALTLTLTLIL